MDLLFAIALVVLICLIFDLGRKWEQFDVEYKEKHSGYLCTECPSTEINPYSTSLCKDCQIKLLMSLLEDCEKES